MNGRQSALGKCFMDTLPSKQLEGTTYKAKFFHSISIANYGQVHESPLILEFVNYCADILSQFFQMMGR